MTSFFKSKTYSYFTPWAIYNHWISPPIADNLNCTDKKVIITGGSTGIGAETCKILAANGCRDITILSRSEEKAENLIDECKSIFRDHFDRAHDLDKNLKLNYNFQKLDLSSIKDCKNISKSLSSCDVLINNAGTWPKMQKFTEEGHEFGFAVNHLGHFALTVSYLNNLKLNSIKYPERIIILSSTAHLRTHAEGIEFDDMSYKNRGFNSARSYSQNKLCNMLFAKELAKKVPQTNNNSSNTIVNAVHPGVVATELFQDIGLPKFISNLFMRSAYHGAMTTIYCGFSEDDDAKVSGKFFENCCQSEGNVNQAGNDVGLMQKLWDLSVRETGVDLI